MALTPKERTALAAARKTVAELGAKEEETITVAGDVLWCAGLTLRSGFDTATVCREHAKAIRDALEPFDDGERIEVIAPQPLGDVLREANQ